MDKRNRAALDEGYIGWYRCSETVPDTPRPILIWEHGELRVGHFREGVDDKYEWRIHNYSPIPYAYGGDQSWWCDIVRPPSATLADMATGWIEDDFEDE